MADQSYYIYGLVDPTQAADDADLLASLMYVGKGTGVRADQHVAEVRRTLADGLNADALSNRGKVERIIDLLDSGVEPRSVKLAAGLRNESDAYIAEAFAIELVSEILSSRGKPPLTNAVKGHGRSIMALDEHRLFVSAEDLRLEGLDDEEPETTRGFDPGDEFSAIFVKLKIGELDAFTHQAVGARDSRVLEMSDGAPDGVRASWNPFVPWAGVQAHERAYRYWKFAMPRVQAWFDDPRSCPDHLVALVPDSGRSVARYVWPIDKAGVWERYKQPAGWGVPLIGPDRPVADHPLLGRVPRNLKGAGILHGYATGVRAGRFRIAEEADDSVVG